MNQPTAAESHSHRGLCITAIGLVKFLLWLGFFTYIVVRIFALDVTGDELPYPFSIAEILSLKNIEEQLQPLIYILSTISKDLFSLDVITEIRLPCIPIFMFYGYAAARLTRRIQPAWLGLLAFVAFLSNPFMLDFFSLQRGYGLSMLFILLSASFAVDMLTGVESRRTRYAAFSVWAGSFAVVSNLACLHYYIGLCLFLVCASLDWSAVPSGWKRFGTWSALVKQGWDRNQYLLANGIMLGLFWLPRLILLVQGNELYSGGEKGFIHDTVGSFVACSLYDIAAPMFHDIRNPYPITLILAALLSAASVAIAIHSTLRRRRSSIDAACFVFSILLMLMVASINLQRHLAGVRFIWERATLILLPLFVGQIVLYAASARSSVLRGIVVAFLVAWVALFPANANLTHTWTWHMMSMTRRLLTDLDHLRSQSGKETLIVGVSDATKPKIQYYMDQRGIKWLQWYPIDMYTRFNGQYQIHPQTDYFYIWHKDGGLPEGLKGLPIEPVPGVDHTGAQCGLYRVKAGADLGKIVGAAP